MAQINHKRYPQTVAKSTPLKCRSDENGKIHFDIPDINALPTFKQLIDKQNNKQLPSYTKQQLSTQYGIHPDVINMTSITAKDYVFPKSSQSEDNGDLEKYTDIIFHEDDAFEDNYHNENNHNSNKNKSIHENTDYLYDDWGDIDADYDFAKHVRNNIRSDKDSNDIKMNKKNNGKSCNDAYNELLDIGFDNELLKKKWVRHHWRMIIWKLACIERSFAFKLSNLYFNYENVLEHLKYRYEWELNKANTSIVDKIYRGDFPAESYMILCVSHIIFANNENKMNKNRLFLSDGWYEIEAQFVDSEIEQLVDSGDIKLGDKLKICMAKKDGGRNCQPLEHTAVETSLYLSRNCVRKARWYDKLGYKSIIPNKFRFH